MKKQVYIIEGEVPDINKNEEMVETIFLNTR